MNPNDNEHDSDDLAQRLRELPAERIPPAAVWQRIAAELQHPRQPQPVVITPSMLRPATHRPPRRWPWFAGAAAAAVLALVGSAALWQPQERAPPVSPLQAQAKALTRDYGLAIAAIPQDSVPAELLPALQELDASAGDIRRAIEISPQAGFLLGQLQRTYALRLELTRQGLGGAGLST